MPEFNIRESFSWLAPEIFKVQDIGKSKVRVKGVALKDNILSKNQRKYVEEELIKSARTWVGVPVTINHDPRRIVGNVDWAEYEKGTLEYLMTISKQPYVDWLREKNPHIKGVSVEADYLYNRCTKCGEKFFTEEAFKEHMATQHFVKNPITEPHGIRGRFLSLVVSPEVPGVEGTTTELWETLQKSSPLQLLEIVTTVKKQELEWKDKMKKTAVTSTPKRIAADITKLKEQKEEQKPEDIKLGSHYCEEHPDDPRCIEHKEKIHGKEPAKEQTEQELPEPHVEAPSHCPEGFEDDGVGGCKPVEWKAEPTADTPAPLMVPEPTIEPPKTEAPPIPAPAQVAGPLIEQEEQLPPAPFPTTPTEAPATVTRECPPNSHWDKAAGTCVPDEITEQPAGTEGRTEATGGLTEIKLPKTLSLGEPFADYSSFEDCVAKNRGKVDDPEAYCATIKRKTEGETVKETMNLNIYEALSRLDTQGFVRDLKTAETVNQFQKALAAVYNNQRLILRVINKMVLTENMLANTNARQLQNYMIELHKYGNRQLRGYATAINKYVNTKLSQLATDNSKLRRELKETRIQLEQKIKEQERDYRTIINAVDDKYKEVVTENKSLKQRAKEQDEELEKRKCGPDEHYDEEKQVCVPNEPKEKTEETKKLVETLTTRIDNLEAKQKGEFKGHNKSLSESGKGESYGKISEKMRKTAPKR